MIHLVAMLANAGRIVAAESETHVDRASANGSVTLDCPLCGAKRVCVEGNHAVLHHRKPNCRGDVYVFRVDPPRRRR